MKFKTIFSIFLLLVAFNFQNCGASKKIKNPNINGGGLTTWASVGR